MRQSVGSGITLTLEGINKTRAIRSEVTPESPPGKLFECTVLNRHPNLTPINRIVLPAEAGQITPLLELCH